MPDPTLFDQQSAARIARTVITVEGWPRSAVGSVEAAEDFRTPETIWALILARGAGADDWKYSWAERRPLKAGTWEAPTGGRSGTVSEHFAINVNKDLDLIDVVGRVVLLRRVQYLEPSSNLTSPPTPEQWLPAWGIVAPAVWEARQADAVVVTAPEFLNVGTNRATADVLELAAQTIGTRNGAALQFKSAGATYQVLQRNGANVVWDDVRAT